MRIVRAFLVTACFLFLLTWFAALETGFIAWITSGQNAFAVNEALILHRLEYVGILAIGWGVGVVAWLVTGHQAMECFFRRMPRAWTLWRKEVLTSSLPALKYLLGGGLLLAVGAELAKQLWGLWMEAYDVGLLTGGIVGVIFSLSETEKRSSQIDFLEANQRYVNEGKVSIFTQYDKP